MKFLEDKVEAIKAKYFVKGAPFYKYWPLFDALDTFLFSPKDPTHQGPHIRDALNTKRYMGIVILALHPPMIYAFWNAGVQSLGANAPMLDIILKGTEIFLPILIVSYAVGLFWEFFFCILKGHAISEGYLVSGLLIALIMPPTIPLWMLAIGVSFGVILVKEVFGGSGMNILNPALSVRTFLYFTYPQAMSGNAVWVSGSGSGISGATVLGEAQSATLAFQTQVEEYYRLASEGVQSVVPQITELVKAGSFSAGDLNISQFDLFIGNHPGSLGETSIVMSLLGMVLLLITGIGSWRTMFTVFAGAFLTALLYNFIGSSQIEAFNAVTASGGAVAAADQVIPNLYYNMPAYYHFLIGGLVFGAVFMATDPVSSPSTTTAKYIYGFMIGALTIVIRVSNPAYPEGIMMAIIFMNVFAPTLDHYVVQSRINKRKARYAQQ